MEKVSVIIPVYNDLSGIKQCLAALSIQDYCLDAIQVIVVDNGSTPEIRLDNDYPFELKLLVCRKKGSYSARNAGVAAADGDIFAFTDADCVPAMSWISEGISVLASLDYASVIGGQVSFYPPEFRTGVALYQYAVGFQQKENIKEKGFSTTANLFCTRSHFEKAGLFEEQLLSCADRLWCWQAINVGFPLVFAKTAEVFTSTRTSLSEALTQARRIAGGRYYLKKLPHSSIPAEGISQRRKGMQALLWILRIPYLSFFERLKVLMCAVMLSMAKRFEQFLLLMGKKPERR